MGVAKNYTDQRLYNHAVPVHSIAMNQDDTMTKELSGCDNPYQRLRQTWLVL